MTLDSMMYSPLVYEKVDGKYILSRDLSIDITAHDANYVPYRMHVLIKAGFVSDGASVPKAFQWILPSWKEQGGAGFNVAALLHDALYGEKGFGQLSREECDDLYRGALRENGLPRWKASLVDMALFFAGWTKSHWGDAGNNAGKSALKIVRA